MINEIYHKNLFQSIKIYIMGKMGKVKNNEIKIYRLLLSLYPKSYLERYKILMEQTFRNIIFDLKIRIITVYIVIPYVAVKLI
jgi:hypothetical protein